MTDPFEEGVPNKAPKEEKSYVEVKLADTEALAHSITDLAANYGKPKVYARNPYSGESDRQTLDPLFENETDKPQKAYLDSLSLALRKAAADGAKTMTRQEYKDFLDAHSVVYADQSGINNAEFLTVNAHCLLRFQDGCDRGKPAHAL